MGAYQDHAEDAYLDGFEPVPIPSGQKGPRVTGWNSGEMTLARVSSMAKRNHPGMGFRTGRLVALDLDITDADLSVAVEQMVQTIAPSAIKRVGQAPKLALLYQRAPEELVQPKQTSAKYAGAHIEVLGKGQQVMVDGIHPTTNAPYDYPAEHWNARPLEEYPVISQVQVDEILARFHDLAREHGLKELAPPSTGHSLTLAGSHDEEALWLASHRPSLGLPIEQAADLLSDHPMADYPSWVRTGMALHHEYHGSPEALQLWQELSWDDANCEEKWHSFRDEPGTLPVTLFSILKDLPGGTEAVEQTKTIVEPTDTFGWDDLSSDDSPPAQLVQRLLVQGETSLMSAQPNTGKSALALDIACHVGAGLPWNGCKVQQAGVIYVAAESPASVKARLIAAKGEGTFTDVDIRVTQRPVNLSTPEGRLDFARRMDTYATALDHPLGLLIVDTYRNATPGGDEKEGKDISAVVNFLHGFAEERHCHLMIVHHTTKSGESYSGSGVFGAVVDTELVLREGDKEREGLVEMFVKQQRSLSTKGDSSWYRLVSANTGRIDNFGDPETAPLVSYITELELAEREQELRDEKEAQVLSQIAADARQVAQAQLEGHSSLAAVNSHTGLSHGRIKKARKWSVEVCQPPIMRRLGDGNGAKYVTEKEALDALIWGS